MADDRQNPLALTEDQLRALVLLQQIQFEKLHKLLVGKGLIIEDDWLVHVERVTEADVASALLKLKDTPRFRDLKLT